MSKSQAGIAEARGERSDILENNYLNVYPMGEAKGAAKLASKEIS